MMRHRAAAAKRGTGVSVLTRRQLLAAASASPLAAAASPAPLLCLFTKHLPHLGYRELASTLRSMGFAGADLTARPRGHVLPENVERDLPRAYEALAAEGVALPMITTGLLSSRDPAARTTLYTAARLGVPFFKLGYFRYRGYDGFDERLARVKADVESLAAIASHAGITGGFHNHSGDYVGSALWDHWWVLRDTSPDHVGFYFDPCHATIEGGSAGWEIGFHRLQPHVRMVACKDFRWERAEGGRWRPRMCPLGEGMVDYPRFFELLAASGFSGPISLHVEYPIDAPTEAQRIDREMQAIERDFARLRGFFEGAYGRA